MKKVYVVIMICGSYDDIMHIPIKVYADPDEADSDILDSKNIREQALLDLKVFYEWESNNIPYYNNPYDNHIDEADNFYEERDKRIREFKDIYSKKLSENFGVEIDRSYIDLYANGVPMFSVKSVPFEDF